MRQLLKIWFVIIGISVLPAVVSAQSATETYRRDTGSRDNVLDIYMPRGAQNAPVMIYVHGGAWQTGTRSNVGSKAEWFNAQGWVFVSVDYRLVPDVAVENQIDDIDHALRWVFDNISRYGGNPNNLHLMGHSAGAHLVAMIGINPGQQSRRVVNSGALKTVIGNDTRTYDVPGLAATTRTGRLPRLFANAFGDDPARWQALSPQYHIKRGPKPAFLLMYSGQGDGDSRGEFSVNFANALAAAGARATLFDGRHYNHAQINRNIGRPGDITATIAAFLAPYQ